jgi:electron transfer flavoprotein beta subunit
MIIAVCMKQLRYLYARTGKDPELNFVGPWDHVGLNNPLDEVALEKAVQIKESLGKGEIWTLSVGEELLEREARRCLALGSDHFVRIDEPAWGQMDAWTTSLALSRAVRKISATLVLCGTRSLDLSRSQVGCYLASHLEYPYVSSAVSIEDSPDQRPWIVRRSLGRGCLEELECRLPLVLGVERSLCEPRYPSRAARLRAEKQDILLWGDRDLNLHRSLMVPRIKAGTMRSPRPKPKWIPVPDATWPARDRIHFLLSPDVQEKKGEVVNEEPEKLARRLMEFLRNSGMLPGKTPQGHE